MEAKANNTMVCTAAPIVADTCTHANWTTAMSQVFTELTAITQLIDFA